MFVSHTIEVSHGDSEKLDEDFLRFCGLCNNAVVRSWMENSDQESANKNIIWPLKFGGCHTDFERVCTLMELTCAKTFILSSEFTMLGKKSDERARIRRQMGNNAWQKQDFTSALYLYTEAVLNAESEEEKAFAFGNRSCVLFRLRAYSEALEDIQMALLCCAYLQFQLNYPQNRRARLIIRQAQSLYNLGRYEEAKLKFNSANELAQMTGSEAPADTVLETIRTGLEKCSLSLKSKKTAKPPRVREAPLLVSHPSPPVVRTSDKMRKKSKAKSPLKAKSSLDVKHQLSSSLDIHLDEDMGWSLIARHDLKPGDLIVVDYPYAQRIHKDTVKFHCYQCFRRCINPIPCRRCCEVVFCSISCEEFAWTPDWSDGSGPELPVNGRPCHRFECGQLRRVTLSDYAGWKYLRSQPPDPNASKWARQFRDRLLMWPGDYCVGGPNVSWTAFACASRTPPRVIRAFAQSSASNGERSSDVVTPNRSPLLAFSGHRDFPESGLDADNYCSIGWLASNSEKRTPHDLWQRTVAAVFLTHCLSVGGYPLDWDRGRCLLEPSADVVPSAEGKLPASWMAACVLHLLQCVASNAHSFTELKFFERQKSLMLDDNDSDVHIDLNRLHFEEIASGLYPTLSLLNHSCDPNTFQVFMRNGACGLFALAPVRAGQTLFGNYGAQYCVQTWEERQSYLLGQYKFECQCVACSEKWAGLNDVVRLLCPKCSNPIGDSTSSDLFNTVKPVCTCPPSTQLVSVAKFCKLVREDLDKKMQLIPEEFEKLSFSELNEQFLDKHIAYIVRMLGCEGLDGLLTRPQRYFDWLQETLKILLQLRFGCYYVEKRISHETECPVS